MALKNIQMYCLNGFETAEQMDLVLLSRDRKLKMVVTQIKQKRNSDPHVDIGCSGLVWWSMITKDPAASLLLLQHLQPTASTSRSKVAASAPANMLTFQPARRSKQKQGMPLPLRNPLWKVSFSTSTYISLVRSLTGPQPAAREA